MKYEYKIVNFTPNEMSIIEFLNQNGKEGWELIMINDYTNYYFKRRY